MEIKQTDLALLKVLHDNTTSNFPNLIKDFREITQAVERLNYSLFEAKYQQQEWEQHREVLVVKFAGLNYSLSQLLEGSEVTDIFDVKKDAKSTRYKRYLSNYPLTDRNLSNDLLFEL